MTQDSYMTTERTKRYDIPLSHLDHNYIKDCSDTKELEKILRILRSGEEGCYPHLEKEAEEQLQKLDPKSRVLRKDAPVLTKRDLDKSEVENLEEDLQSWENTMEYMEQALTSNTGNKILKEEDAGLEENPDLPPIRSGSIIGGSKKTTDSADEKTKKKVSKKPQPRTYQEWDKFDVDKELEQNTENKDEEKPKLKSFKAEEIKHHIDTSGMSEEEKKLKAVREKDKGNEAFHSHDYEESILYYTRSLSISPLVATYNNRALAYLRLSKWDKAIEDCKQVLSEEPKNIKALLRRGTALKGKKDFKSAMQDLQEVLEMEPNNKTAKNLLDEIDTEMMKEAEEVKKRKEKGRRMVITEVDGSDDEGSKVEEVKVEKSPESCKNLLNGHNMEQSYQTKTVSEATEHSKDIWSEVDFEPCSAETQINQNIQILDVDVSSPSPAATVSPKTGVEISKEYLHHHIQTESTTETGKFQNGIPSTSDTAFDDKCEKLEESDFISIISQVPVEIDARPEEKVDEENNLGSKDTENVDHDGKSNEELTPDSTTSSFKAGTHIYEEEREDENQEMEVGESAVENSKEQPVFVHLSLPDTLTDLKERGNVLFRSGQYPEAITIYSEVITHLETLNGQTVNLSLLYSNRAVCHLKTGNCQAAIEDCRLSLSLVPHSIKPLMRRASAYEHLEKYHYAYVDYKHVLSIDSKNLQAHQGATRCHHVLADLNGAKWREKLPPLVQVKHWDIPVIIDESSVLSRMISEPVHPDNTVTQSLAQKVQTGGAGDPVDSLQEKQEHVESLEENIENAPQFKAVSTTTDVSIDLQITDSTRQEETPRQKRQEEQKPAKSKEEQFEDWKGQGNKHVQKGEYKQAVEFYSRCLELFTDRTAIYTNRALCYLKLDKGQEAEEDCNKAMVLEPNNAKALYRRALAKKMKAQYKESLQDLLQLLRIESNNMAAKREMELIKKLYKQEYDQLKRHGAHGDKKKLLEPEKKRTRVHIEEVEDESELENEQDKLPKSVNVKSPSQPKSPPAHVPKQPPASSPADKASIPNQTDIRKPGRAKSKKITIKQTSMGLPVTPPSTPKPHGKITPYEFIQHWNALKQAKDIQPYVQLLEQIAPEDLPKVISNKLDGHMLQIISRCAAHDALTGEVDRGYKVLYNLRMVPRFSTVVLFLSNKEKQDIRKVFELTTALGTYTLETIAAVKKDYGIK